MFTCAPQRNDQQQFAELAFFGRNSEILYIHEGFLQIARFIASTSCQLEAVMPEEQADTQPAPP